MTRFLEEHGRRIALLCLASVLALAAWLRFHDLAAQSLWGDEAISWQQASHDLWGVIHFTARDNYPPLHNLLLHAAIVCCGDGEAALRAPSALAGVLTVAALYWVGATVGGRAVGLLAALLLALSNFHIWYSQEARPYALFALLSTLFVGASLRAFATRGRAWAAASGVAALLLLYTHPYGLFVWGCVSGVLLLFALRRRTIHKQRAWIAAQGGAALGFLPWAVILALRYRSLRRLGFWIPAPTPTFVVEQIEGFAGGRILSIILLVAAALALILAIGSRRWRPAEGAIARDEPDTAQGLALLAWLVGPFALGLAASLLGTPILLSRYLIGSLPALFLLASLACRQIARGRHLAFLAAAAILVLSVLAFQKPMQPRVDWRDAVAFYHTRAEPADCLVFYKGWISLIYKYYDRQPHSCGQTVNSLSDLDWSALDSPRVWFFVSGAGPSAAAVLRDLDDRGWPHGQRQLDGVTVIYALRPVVR